MTKKRKAGIVGVVAFTAVALCVTTVSAQATSGPGARSASANSGHPVMLKPPKSHQGPTLLKKKTAAAPSWAQTLCFGSVNNNAILPWYGAPVSASQPVAVSASEGTYGGEFIGDAPIYPVNVQVVNSSVFVRIATGWGSPLNVCVHYIG